MVPTLNKRLTAASDATNNDKRQARDWRDWLASVGMLLCDEADKATSASWRKILRYASGTRYRVGFSGSFPERDTIGDLQLEEDIGPIVLRVKNYDLIEREISARPTVHLHRFHADIELPKGWRELTGPERRTIVYDRGVIYNHVRHNYVCSLIEPNVPTVVVVERIDHGQQLCEQIPGSVFLDGSATKTQRADVLTRFKHNEFGVLIVTRIMDRGTNELGHAGCLIFASGMGSTRQTLQRIGRGLRRGGGKSHIRIVDIMDTSHDYLVDASQSRLKLYNQEGFQVRIIRGSESAQIAAITGA
jgi:superfamily II DNA or RNA helicase